MQAELDHLEAKLLALVDELSVLRGDNLGLRQRVSALEADKARLEHKLTVAITRIESVLTRIPAEEEPL